MAGVIEVALCLAILYWLFSDRASAMVGVVSERMQEAYGSWSKTNSKECAELRSAAALRSIADQKRRRRMMEKDCELTIRENLLYQIKEQPMRQYGLPTKPILGFACKDCSPTTVQSQVDPILRHSKVVRDVLRGTDNGIPYGSRGCRSFFSQWTPHLAQALACRKFAYPQVSHKVLKTERLELALDQATIDTLKEEKLERKTKRKENNYDAESSSDDSTHSPTRSDFDQRRFKEVRKKHEERAKRILLDMRSKLSDFMLRVTSWMLYKLLPCFLRGVAAHPAQIDMLRNVAERAEGVPLIFMPLHRSHLDYILISFILLNNNIKSPLVAAGNNLRIPFFGSMLRGLGAFYIKRRIDPADGKKDHVYRAVLHTYLQKCLGAGHNVEFFIEGGRTRTGKPCMPKGGILSVIVDAFLDGTIPDAYLVPVSVHYERLVDGNFISEQLGRSKRAESFSSAVRAIWTTLHSDFGVMRIDFNEPLSIKELVRAFGQRQQIEQQQMSALNANNVAPADRRLRHEPSTTSLYGTDVVQEEIRTLVDSIGRHIVYDCAKATAVMSTSAVSFLLLTRFRNGCDIETLTTELDRFRVELESESRNLGFTGKSLDVIEYAMKLLGPDLIEKTLRNGTTFVKPVTSLPNVIELSYYSNCLIPCYALKSIIVTSFEYLLSQNASAVLQNDLINICLELCDTLRYEFILHKPCQSLESQLLDSLESLCSRAVLIMPQKFYTEDEKWTRRFAATLDICDNSDDDDYGDYEREETNKPVIEPGTSPEALKVRSSLISVLSPLLNAYLCTANCLENLLKGPMPETEFIQVVLQEIQKQVDNGTCKHSESLSSDSVRNALKLFGKWGVLENRPVPYSSSRVRVVTLGLHWDTIDGVQNVIQKIKRYYITS